MEDRMTAWLACKGRRGKRTPGGHRPVMVYRYDGPWPLPRPHHPGERGSHSTLDLNCGRCGFAPRASDGGLRNLIEMAAAKPGRILYIDGP
jgi:hypothetical protein